MKVQHSEYAMTKDVVYHAHVDCPRGRTWRATAEVHGPAAVEGRTYCKECRLMDPPVMPPPPERRAYERGEDLS